MPNSERYPWPDKWGKGMFSSFTLGQFPFIKEPAWPMPEVQEPTMLIDLSKLNKTIVELKKISRTLKKVSETLSIKKNMFITSLHDSRLKLKEPISVFIENDGYQFIAYASDLDIYGCGDLEYEALEDLRASIVDLYFDLKGDRLASPLQKIWDYLNSIAKENED